MKSISSTQNPWVKRLRTAVRDPAGEIAIEGPRFVRDALAAGWEPVAIITRSGVEFDAAGPALIEFSRGLFESLSGTEHSQGVIGLFRRPAPAPLFAERDRNVVALDGVQDPGNVGTIVRLAAAFDCAGVALLPGSADAFGPKSVRASAGAILSMPVVRMSREALIESGWPLFAAATTGTGAEVPASGSVLVLGSEGGGISSEIAARATPIRIPMSARVESLNVAAAAAILLARSFAARIT